jgi:hypothetical protein
MKLPLSLGVFALAGFVALEAEAGQQSLAIERGQKARPDLGMPHDPGMPQNVPVMIAQANQAQAGNAMARTIGVCATAPNQNYSGENGLAPIYSSQSYFEMYESRTVTGPATTTILQQPKHGVLRLVTETDSGTLFSSKSGPLDPSDPGYAYLPESGYVGQDSATILVDFGSVKVTVKYYFHAVSGPVGDNWIQEYCAPKGMYWKISSNLDGNGANTITSVEYQSPATSATGATAIDTATLASTLGTTQMTASTLQHFAGNNWHSHL